jgi:hypothetical protein
MSTVQTILNVLTGIIAALSVLTGITAAALAYFGVRLTNKNTAEMSAADRKQQLDIERIKATQFEFQTKFSLYHQKRADVIDDLYAKLSDTETILSQLVSLNQSYEGRTPEEQGCLADKAIVKLARLFDKKRIYLDEELCGQMDTIIGAMREAQARFHVSQERPRPDRADTQLWADAWKIVSQHVPPIKKALEQQFRQILSASPPINSKEQADMADQ